MVAIPDSLVEKAERILGYTFKDKDLLRLALTHPSATRNGTVNDSYERLEFLGDSIVGMCVAEELYTLYPDLAEGDLTRLKVSLVSGATLSAVAEELGLDEVIVFGASEAGTGGRGLYSARENVYEALTAAIYLDGGMEASRAWVLSTLKGRFSLDLAKRLENPKSSLQEFLQSKGFLPTYRIASEDGPPHDRRFTAEVLVDDEVVGSGEGTSKKEAESRAAKEALRRLC